MNKRRILSVTAVLFTLGLSKGAALFSSIAIARIFPDKDLSGAVFFITGFVVLSMPFSTFGISAASNFFIPRNIRRGRHARNLQMIHLAAVVAILPSLLFGIIATYLGEDGLPNAIILTIICIFLSCYFSAFRQLAKQYMTLSGNRSWGLVHESISFNAALIGCFLVLPEKNIEYALIAVVFASIFSGALAYTHVARNNYRLSTKSSPLLASRKYSLRILGVSFPSMIAQGGTALLNKIDVIMIAPLAGIAAVADYSVALRITYITTAAGEILIALAVTKLGQLSASGDKKALWNYLKRMTLIQTVLVLISAIPLLVFSEQIITMIYGESYRTAATPFLLLQIGKIFTGVFAPALIVFTAIGLNKSLARATVVAAIVNIAVNFALVPTYGATGAAIATLVALLILCASYARLMINIASEESHRTQQR